MKKKEKSERNHVIRIQILGFAFLLKQIHTAF
jgi:hypothetical protein